MEGDVRIAAITGDSTSYSSRAIIKNMQIIAENPAGNFVTTLVLRLKRVLHLRMAIEVAKNE